MHHPTDRIAHTTAFVTPVVEHWLEREIAQLVHPMKDRSDDPSHHERTLLPRSYISLSRDDRVCYPKDCCNFSDSQDFSIFYDFLNSLDAFISGDTGVETDNTEG